MFSNFNRVFLTTSCVSTFTYILHVPLFCAKPTLLEQGVVLKGIFPRGGGSAKVRLAAGSWDSGVTASSGDGGKAVSAVMAYPKGVAIDTDGTLYVAEFQGEKIRKVSTAGIISTVVGTGSTVR